MSEPRHILRIPDVQTRTGLARSTIYALIARAEFPAPVRLTARAVGWDARAIDEWIRSRTRAGEA